MNWETIQIYEGSGFNPYKVVEDGLVKRASYDGESVLLYFNDDQRIKISSDFRTVASFVEFLKKSGVSVRNA